MIKYNSIQEVIFDLSQLIGSHNYNGLIASTIINDLKYHATDQNITKYLDIVIGFEHKGKRYPFYLANDYLDNTKKCLIPIMSGYFYFYKLYHEMMLDYSNIEVGVSFPIIIKENLPSTFRDFLKTCKMDMISHFYGSKSKEVVWSLNNKENLLELATQTTDEFLQQSFNYLEKNPDEKHKIIHQTLNWFEDVSIADYSVAAHYYENSNISVIANMYLFKIGDVLHCQKIATNKNDKYKKYSLTLNAQLAVIKFIYDMSKEFETVKYIDLGCNFDPDGQYKKVIPYTEYPIINFKNSFIKELL